MRPLSVISVIAAVNWQRIVDGRYLAWALGPLLSALLIAASTATADTAVVGLSPKVAGRAIRLISGLAVGPALPMRHSRSR